MSLLHLPLIYNVEIHAQTNSAGIPDVEDFEAVTVTYNDEDLVIAMDFIRSDGNPVTGWLDGTETYSFVARQVFTGGSTKILETLDVGFNVPLDRPDLDIANAKISFRVDAFTAAGLAALGTAESIILKGQVKIICSGSSRPNAQLTFDVILKAQTDDVDTDPPLPGPSATAFAGIAGEALTAGEEVNVYDSDGTWKVRRASAQNHYRRSHGYVKTTVAENAIVTVFQGGTNPDKSGLTPGDYFLSVTKGAVTQTAPTGAQQIVQHLGASLSATELAYSDKAPFQLGGTTTTTTSTVTTTTTTTTTT